MANIINASVSSGLIQTADTSGTIELQSSGSTKLTVNSSGAVIDTLKSSSGVFATQNGINGIAKAWVNFNANGVAAVRTSFNISSVVRVSTGIFTVNFTSAMPDANYCYQMCARDLANGMGVPTVQADPDRSLTTSSLPIIYNYPPTAGYFDADTITVTVFSL
jgi:hypothetical protein